MDFHDIFIFENGDEDNSTLEHWQKSIQRWKDSGKTVPESHPPPTSGREDTDIEAYFNEESEDETKPLFKLPNLVKEENSSDSSSGTSSNEKRKLKRRKVNKETLSSVKKLEVSQNNTDKQLQIIADSQNEIKALFLDTQSSLKILQEKNSANENTIRIIQEGIASNNLAIKSNVNLAKEQNLLLDNRLDLIVKQGKEHNDKIEAKQDLLAKQEIEHNQKIEERLDNLAEKDKEVCTPPTTQPPSINNTDASNSVQKEQSNNAETDIESQLKPAIEEPHVSTNIVNFPPTDNQISTIVGSEETVSNSLDSVSPTLKLKVKTKALKKRLKRKQKVSPVSKQTEVESVGNKTEVESVSNTRSFVEEFFKFLIAFMKEITGIMKSPTGILWGLVFLLLVHPKFIHGSPLNSLEIDNIPAKVNYLSPLNTLVQNFQQEKDFTFYTVESYDAMSFTFPLKEIKTEQFNGMTDACNGISAQHELCLNHPGSCQTSKITTDNFEEAIELFGF